MGANPNWARWTFASIAHYLKKVAEDNSLPAIVEGSDDRTDEYMQATDRAEIRITGPFTKELSGEYLLYMDVNVLLTSRYDGQVKNRYALLKDAGLFHEAMDKAIRIYRYGNEPGDDDSLLGCLVPRSGKNDSIRVVHFGQIDPTDKIKQSAVDARYEMYLSEDS
jgi:hypothetical protein